MSDRPSHTLQLAFPCDSTWSLPVSSKLIEKNNPKSSTPSRIPLGQDEKQIHIYQSLNKKTINHWKHLMQNSKDCSLKVNSTEHWSYSGTQGKGKYWISLQICTTYTWQRHTALCLNKSRSIHHADIHHSLTLSPEKLQHSILWLARVQCDSLPLQNLTISRIFSEVW